MDLAFLENQVSIFYEKKNDVRVYDDNKFQLKKFKKNTIKKIQILNTKFDYIVISPGIDSKKVWFEIFFAKE